MARSSYFEKAVAIKSVHNYNFAHVTLADFVYYHFFVIDFRPGDLT